MAEATSNTYIATSGDPGEPFTAGNPINFHTGVKLEAADDYAVDGSHLAFSRFYTSAKDLHAATQMGKAWRHNFMRNIVVVDAETVRVTRPSGNAYTYRKRFGEWMREIDVNYVLSEVITDNIFSGWTLRGPDNSKEYFNPNGFLTSIEWSDGDFIYLSYDGDFLATVTDSRGRSLQFIYTDELLTGVIQPDARELIYSYDSNDRLSKVEFKDDGVVTQVARYGYTSADHETALTERRDESDAIYATWEYDAQGRAISSTHGAPAGGIDRVTFAYQAGSTVVTDAVGHQSVVSKLVVNRRAKSSGFSAPCPACNGEAYASQTYDFSGNPRVHTDFGGRVTEFEYTSENLLSRIVEAADQPNYTRSTETHWHTAFRLPTQRDTRDHTGTLVQRLTWAYNTRGQVTSATIIDPASAASRTTSYGYCEAADVAAALCPREGLLLWVDGPLIDKVDQTTYSYYPSSAPSCTAVPSSCPYRKGDLWRVTNALGQATEVLAYDGAGRPLTVSDANGVITDYEYHARGWLAGSTTRGDQGTWDTGHTAFRIQYWPTGLVRRITQADETYLEYSYDQAHRLVLVSDQAGNSIRYQLDNAGNRISEEIKDTGGTLKHRLNRAFSSTRQLQTLADAQANQTHFAYDSSGNLSGITNALGALDSRSFDPLNRLSRSVQDVGGVNSEAHYSYDALDNLVQVRDPKGLLTHYERDGFGQIRALHSPDTGATHYSYDSGGNRTQQVDARGQASVYSYDALNRLIGVSYPVGADEDVTFQYDLTSSWCQTGETFSVGRLAVMSDGSGSIHYCYTRLGELARKVQITNGQVLNLSYFYIAGRLRRVTYPDQTVVDYVHDSMGRVVEVGVTPFGAPRQVLVTGSTYEPFGPISGWIYGNGRQMTRAHDQDYRAKIIEDTSNGIELHYTYDAVGQIVGLTASGTSSVAISLGYDGAGRLTSLGDDVSGLPIESYTYDATGNRTSLAGVNTYTYAIDSHRLTGVSGVSRSYDLSGNTTSIGGQEREFIYGSAGRMTQVKRDGLPAMDYVYNGMGEQVRRHLDTTHDITFMYDEHGRLLGEYGSGGIALRQYIWLGDLPIGMMAGQRLHYIQPDHLGTPRAVIDPVRDEAIWTWQLTSEAFGNSPPHADPDQDGVEFEMPLRFPGQRYDPFSGLNYNYFRNYDPATGRYIESDLIGLGGGLNTYAYVGGNPINLVDELGLQGRRPNSWNRFQQQAGGRGLTQSEILSIYRQTQLQNMGWNRPLQNALDNFPSPVPVPDISTVKCDIHGYCTVEVNTCTCAKETMTACPAKKEPVVGPMPQDNPTCSCSKSVMPINI
nr:RHS repeat-associated core domain-containing protein [Pseudoxanthomonas broegbernensis]